MVAEHGRSRVVIEDVQPAVDDGRFAAKRVAGDTVVVEADVFTDGHDLPRAVIIYRHQSQREWSEVPMTPLVNDRWRGEFHVANIGEYRFTVRGWIDRFATWRRDLSKRVAANQDAGLDLRIGLLLVEEAAAAASGEGKQQLREFAAQLQDDSSRQFPMQIAGNGDLERLMHRWLPRRFATTYARELPLLVDRPRAGFSAWYEFFPRSSATESRHGTLRDVESRLSYVAEMGFDVLYLPPIHPIGRAYRKGPNNAVTAGVNDPGSPWAIGASEGGHKAIHPELGTLDDFHRVVSTASSLGIELAMDIAFQCSPDHPYVHEHPEWFRKRPDGSIQYAENPPKKYQDIYPFDFECDAWESLWAELKSVFMYWIEQGVKIFRVDNPHTKPFPFWEWVIAEVRRDHPDVLFLAEAFTRPKVMHRLAKLGFSQSYTYFAWRDTKYELTQYLTALTRSEVREFFRPNLWPNTPDTLPESLQLGGRPVFMARLVLAATLAGNYGIYGPPFEHFWSAPRDPGSEEYLHSEKYQVHQHDWERPDSLKDFIGRVNRIRQGSPALAHGGELNFHSVDNDELICYSRVAGDLTDVVLVVVNLNPHHTQSGWVTFPLEELSLPGDRPYQMHDLLTDARYLWHGEHNFVELDPHVSPAHIFRLRRKSRSERDFEYFL